VIIADQAEPERLHEISGIVTEESKARGVTTALVIVPAIFLTP
jgi:hypothetical protein